MKLLRMMFVSLILLAVFVSAHAQLTIPALRMDAPIFPATGIWWSGSDGAGRWGLQVELQRQSSESEAVLRIVLFSFRAQLTSIALYI